jgi:hypothetical protein
LSREKSTFVVDSWDSAIRKAKLKIKELKLAIGTFDENKKSGEPWPGQSSRQSSKRQHSV